MKAIIQEQRPALDNVVLTLAFGIPTLTLADICQMSDEDLISFIENVDIAMLEPAEPINQLEQLVISHPKSSSRSTARAGVFYYLFPLLKE